MSSHGRTAPSRAASRSRNMSPASTASSGARCCASCTSASASSRRWCGRWSGCSSSPPASAQVLGVSIIPPYETYILYEVYITPGLIGDDPAVQRHAVARSRWSTTARWAHADAAGQPAAALVPAGLASCSAGVAVSLLQVYAFLADRLVLGRRAAADRLSHRAAGAGPVRADARRARHAAVLGDPAAGELRRA